MGRQKKYLVGVDEVGRGSVAGPVAVGVVVLYSYKRTNIFEGVRDSKKLTQLQREEWAQKIYNAQAQHILDFAVGYSSPFFIDTHGIVRAIQCAMNKALCRLDCPPKDSKIMLDGALYAPLRYLHQTTTIKGDELIPIISLASIVAKVSRDRKMRCFSKKFNEYGFDAHKGYGTKKHFEAIKLHGLCKIHRKTFLKRLP